MMDGQIVVYNDETAVAGGRKSRQRRAPLKPVNLNKAAAVRAKAAQSKRLAADARARELREQLTGGGWCRSAPKPKWIDHDRKVQEKLNGEKGKEDQFDAVKEKEIKFDENDDQEMLRDAMSLLKEWSQVLGNDAEAKITVRALDLQTLQCALQSSREAPGRIQRRAPTLSEARAMLKAAMERLMAGEASAEVEVDKMDQLIQRHPEYIAEQRALREEWNRRQADANAEALATLRRAIPPDVATQTLASLEAILPDARLARRIFTKRVLHLVRMPKIRTARLHIVELRGAYNASSLDLDEARAVYSALPDTWENDASGDKAQWAEDLRNTVIDLVRRQSDTFISRYTGIHLFDTDEAIAVDDDQLAVRSGINDGAAERAAELEDIRLRRKLAKDTKPSPFVVHLRSPRPKVHSPKRTNKLLVACAAATGTNLMDQLKARLRARNEALSASRQSTSSPKASPLDH